MAAAPSIVRITPTSIDKGYVDVGPGLRSFLLDSLQFNVRQMDIGSFKEFSVSCKGSDLTLKINRPRTKEGAFQRLALSKAIVQALGLIAYDELLFSLVDGKIEMSIRRPSVAPSATVAETYPDRLINWFGSQRGGVRLIFDDRSGKPSAEISTLLGQKLLHLGDEMLVAGKAPKLIMLAGGAGNGKTHAIENFLRRIAVGDGNALKDAFLRRSVDKQVIVFAPSSQDQSLFAEAIRKYGKITVIQDASEVSEDGKRPPEILAELLRTAFRADTNNELLLVCVNRGVLYAAATRLRSEPECPAGLEQIVDALDPVNVDKACWPLEDDPEAYVWPLDIDSLAGDGEGRKSVVEQVLERLAEGDWTPVDQFDTAHPLRHSRDCLRTSEFRRAFALALREYEIASGKNISFRGLFSIIAYLFSGGWTALEGNQPPTVFAVRGNLPTASAERGSWEPILSSYAQSLPCLLFPVLPKTAALRIKIKEVKAQAQGELLQELCDGIDRLFARVTRREGIPGADHFVASASEWSLNMDPARASSMPSELPDLERDVALSIRQALKKYRDYIDASSGAVLDWLAFCIEELATLAEDEHLQTTTPRWAIRWVTRLASIILKRSAAVALMSKGQVLLGRSGSVAAYLAQLNLDDVRSIELVEKVCAFMLGEAGNPEREGHHVIELGKGLCQPFSPSHDAAKVVISNQPMGELIEHVPSRPASSLLVVELTETGDDMHLRVPVTMGMYELISSVGERLQLTGSMPAAIRGAIDTFRLQVDGAALRDSKRRFQLQVAGHEIRGLTRTNLAIKAGRLTP